MIKRIVGKLVIALIVVLLLYVIVTLFTPLLTIMFPFLWRVTLPFLVAILISYLLYPILNKLHHTFNMQRNSAIFIIFITFFSLLTFVIYEGMPVFYNEIQELKEQLPYLITLYDEFIVSFYQSASFFPDVIHEQLDSLIIELEATLKRYMEQLMKRLMHSFDLFIHFLMVPVLVFYLLKDMDNIRNYLFHYIPEQNKVVIHRTVIAMHQAIYTYIRGQTVLSLFIFILSFLLYKLIGLNYAFILSLFMGIMNVIPYFGPIIGTIPAIVVALATSWPLVLYVIIIAIIVQLIESTLLSPYIMGKTAKLHPIVIIFILLISSEIGGIIAMIVAIPFVMVIRAIILSLLNEKQQCIDN